MPFGKRDERPVFKFQGASNRECIIEELGSVPGQTDFNHIISRGYCVPHLPQ